MTAVALPNDALRKALKSGRDLRLLPGGKITEEATEPLPRPHNTPRSEPRPEVRVPQDTWD